MPAPGIEVAAALRNRKVLLTLLGTSVLIGTNWLLYVYAINNGHILAGSLGYYLNPLANILLGRFLLGERLATRQWAAVGIAGAGVAVLAAGAGETLWISLILCFSFASYGLLRKIIAGRFARRPVDRNRAAISACAGLAPDRRSRRDSRCSPMAARSTPI